MKLKLQPDSLAVAGSLVSRRVNRSGWHTSTEYLTDSAAYDKADSPLGLQIFQNGLEDFVSFDFLTSECILIKTWKRISVSWIGLRTIDMASLKEFCFSPCQELPFPFSDIDVCVIAQQYSTNKYNHVLCKCHLYLHNQSWKVYMATCIADPQNWADTLSCSTHRKEIVTSVNKDQNQNWD